eukprot:jgi/Tetstr1/461719/TSEL_006809.t1
MTTAEALQRLGQLIREKAPVESLASTLQALAVDPRLVTDELVLIAISSDNVEALAWLVGELHASCLQVYQEGRTALHEAVLHRCPAVIHWTLSGGKHSVDLWFAEDAAGATPLLQAVRERYAEGVEAMCGSDIADGFAISGTASRHGVVMGQAYREAAQALSDPAAESDAREGLTSMMRAMERQLRIMFLNDVQEAVGGGWRSGADRESRPWECKLGEVRRRAEAQPWWASFQAQHQGGTREPAGPQEEWAESEAIKSAVNAAQPGVVEWLLDVWGVDFEAAQLRDPVYSLSDYACGGGEVQAARNTVSTDSDEARCWSREHLRRWVEESGGGPMLVGALVRIVQCTLVREGDRKRKQEYFSGLESARKQLRLLDDLEAKGGALRQAKIIATLELFIDRFNRSAVPRLDLLVQSGNWQVFEWLLSQKTIDMGAPFVESEAGAEDAEDAEDVAVCPVCLDPLPIPALYCVLQCGHTLCRRCTRGLIHHMPSPEEGGRAGGGAFSCPLCRRVVPFPRFAHSDVMVKLRGDLPDAAPWLFPSGLPAPGPGLPLGAVLLGMAVGMSSLRFVENLVAAGVDPFCRLGGRSLLHIACEQAASGSALWLLEHARQAGRLPELLLSLDQQGRRPLEVAVEVDLEGPAFDRLLDLEARLPDPAVEEEAPRGAWVEKALASSNETVRGAAEWHVAQAVLGGGLEERLRSGCPLAESEIAAAGYAAAIMRAREGGDGASTVCTGAAAAAPDMGDHVLRRFVDDQVVRHGRADVLRWMWLELDWQRWAHFPIPAGPSFASRDAVTAAASKWGLGSAELRLFGDVFDEADRLLEIKGLAKAVADDFARAVVEAGSVEAARAGGGSDGGTRFTDEATHHDASCAMPLCYAAKHGLAELVAWLLERQHHGRGRRVACLRVTGLAATNGHLALAKESWQGIVAEGREAIVAAAQEPPANSPELWDCHLCRHCIEQSRADELDGDGDGINGVALANFLAIRCAHNVLSPGNEPVAERAWPALEWMLAQPEVSCREVLCGIDWHLLGASIMLRPRQQEASSDAASAEAAPTERNSIQLRLLRLLVDSGGASLGAAPAERIRTGQMLELTIGQLMITSGAWLENCWPWLVEERGVDIQSSEIVDEAARRFRCNRNLLDRLRREQRRRFELAAIIVERGFPVEGGAMAEELRSVDLRALRDRAGRPVLTAAIAEQRPQEVLDSITNALKLQEKNGC